MFSFFKRRSEEPKDTSRYIQLPVNTDMHSHVLPGIDDGSPDIETSVALIRGLYNLGIRKTIATPHVISDMYRNTPETINNALEKLKPALAAAQINVEISAAAEYLMDDYFYRLLTNKEKLLTIHKNIVLTEQSFATVTGNLNEIAFELITQGYKPIMAHPERYFYYHDNPENYYHLKDMGFLLQINLLSLTGQYGPAAAKAAKFMLKEGIVDFVGTDLHNDKHLQLFQKKETLNILHHYLSDRVYNDFSIL
ncbi:tyrosine-protein phosphatase [Ferruginibacter albus]|uniref:tyrosine-protein phosphatase n=1 Tax=Ferruginibacter albus TaxID=2875540 RepID=UPI001CC4FADB|nr:CpsB/CapC family capsule biosynthesis tyrosine phosphatase [Ferruginibacter albus]UAY50667.1 histidinol phosphatase [Ferruginibacter albus]